MARKIPRFLRIGGSSLYLWLFLGGIDGDGDLLHAVVVGFGNGDGQIFVLKVVALCGDAFHLIHDPTAQRDAVGVGVMFLLVMFVSPLVAMVPPYATAGALIFVGVLMTSSLARVNWDDFTESVPAFITTVMMPFTFSITEGIALGFMSYCIMKVCTGRWRDLNLCVVVVAALFALKIILVD